MTEAMQALFMALVIGVASGTIGSFIILKRMALVGDALSHVALPGIALALFYQFDPFWGVLGFLLAAAVMVWWLEGKSNLPTDALVGLLFTASLAIGILTIPDHEVVESLFGEFPALPLLLFLFTLTAGIIATFLSLAFARKFLFGIVSKDLAQVSGIGRSADLVLLLIFSFVVALGIKLVGTLLMGALTIIPPSIARNFSPSMKSYIISSLLLGGGIGVTGTLISQQFNLLPGPTIILLGIILFILSLGFVRK